MRPRVQYMGFAGRGNLGDDAIRDVFQDRLSGYEFSTVPVGGRELLFGGLRHGIAARGRPMLVGGGTVLARTLWRHTMRRTDQLFKPSLKVMLGAGVEDPDFRGTQTYSSWEEAAAWKPILDGFESVTVRGPRSREILKAVGIESEMIGDPALLLEPPHAPPPEPPIDILVNLTCGEDQWGGVDLDWTPRVVEALRGPIGGGARIAFVSMDPIDDAWNHRLAELLGVPPVMSRPGTTEELFAVLQDARVVLGTRLHANVLAAAAGIPSVSLEYRPKCRDFMRSIDAEDYCHRVDGLDPAMVAGNLEEVLSAPTAAAEHVRRAVGDLRGKLNAALEHVDVALEAETR